MSEYKSREYTAEEKAAYASKKKEELSAVYKLIDETAEKIFTRERSSVELQRLLDIYSRFSYLGISNALLIYAQMPNAKELHPVKYWNEHNYVPKKGQHAITLIEKGKEYKKNDGSTGYSRNASKYFDVSQTTAHYREAEKTSYATHTLIKALLKSCPINYESYMGGGELSDSEIAKFIPDRKTILVRKGLPFDVFFSQFSTAVVSAMLCRNGDYKTNEAIYRFDAMCVSYLLCKRYDVDTACLEFDDIPEPYMNLDTNRIKEKLYEIVDVEKALHEKLYQQIQSVLKEYQKAADIIQS